MRTTDPLARPSLIPGGAPDPPAPAGNRTAPWRPAAWFAPALVVFFSAVLVHSRCVAFGFIGLDDRDFVVDDQPFLARPLNLLRIFTRAYMHVVDARHAYYRPLVTASYILDAQRSGALPAGYHATNVALHALASVLFFALLRRFALGPAALLGALLFAVHPALVADVAWIPGRNDSLMAILVLSAWLLLPTDSARPHWGRRLSHWAFFGLSLLTKETAIAAPAVWALHILLFEADSVPRGGRSRNRGILVFGWAVAIAARLALGPPAAGLPGNALARNALTNLPLVVASLGALVFPVNPSLLSVSDDLPLWPGIVALSLLGAATWLVPGVRVRIVLLGAAAFVLFLAPAIAAGTTLALNSRLYLPACGVILGAGEIVRALGLAVDRRMMASLSAVTVIALAFVAALYESTFRNRRAFAKAEVESSPHSAMAHFCLGQTYQIDGEADRALAEYRLALSLGAVEVVHNNIAVLNMARADWDAAERELRSELAVNPRYGRAYHNLGIVLRKENRVDEARAAEENAEMLEREAESQ